MAWARGAWLRGIRLVSAGGRLSRLRQMLTKVTGRAPTWAQMSDRLLDGRRRASRNNQTVGLERPADLEHRADLAQQSRSGGICASERAPVQLPAARMPAVSSLSS
jgi:hypothetical protein